MLTQCFSSRTIGFAVLALISLTANALERQENEVRFGKLSLHQHPSAPGKSAHSWRILARQAVDGASEQLQKNLVQVLTEFGRESFKMSRTIKFQIGTLIIALVNGTFDFGNLIASSPKILTETLPVQLVSVLRGMQNEINLNSQLNSTISTLIDFILTAEKSGLSQNIFRPVTNAVPNLLAGVNRFLISILNGMFFLFGARDPAIYATTHDPIGIKIPRFTNKPPQFLHAIVNKA